MAALAGKLKWLAAPLAGLFAVGGIVSLTVGIILAPISLLGMIVLIGFLGFTPLFTSVIYIRNSVRAFRSARPFLDKGLAIRSFALSAMASAAVPYIAYSEIKYLVNEMATADAITVRRSAAKLKFVAPLVDLGPVNSRYYSASEEERHSPRMQSMAEAYRELTGESLETGHYMLD